MNDQIVQSEQMETSKTERFGEISAPETFGELIDSLSQNDTGEFYYAKFWRGQSDIDWPVETTSERRARHSEGMEWTQDIFELSVTSDKWMLERAKHQGFHKLECTELDDWQLITKLRHFGASACLLDVTKNPLVALWFACVGEPKKPGLLVGLHCHHVGGSEGDTNWGPYIKELKGSHASKHPMLYDPNTVSPRVSAQSSCFLFGSGSSSNMGSMVYTEIIDAYSFYYISPDIKEEAMRALDQVFCINRLTLFPDIEGFAQSNSQEYDIGSNQRW
ncbi:MAG: FRG domain-containing protein [Paracoccaceae bacterium]